MNKKVTIGIVIAAVAIMIIYGIVQYMFRPRIVEVTGTITHVVPEERKASFEFEWRGDMMEKTAEVPEDCELLLNGEPVEMKAFRAGDQAEVKIKFWPRTRKFKALSVNVTRKEEKVPATQPVTTQAAS
jgi:hypothetical protein